jgi:hypothetical protein
MRAAHLGVLWALAAVAVLAAMALGVFGAAAEEEHAVAPPIGVTPEPLPLWMLPDEPRPLVFEDRITANRRVLGALGPEAMIPLTADVAAVKWIAGVHDHEPVVLFYHWDSGSGIVLDAAGTERQREITDDQAREALEAALADHEMRMLGLSLVR